MKVLLRSAKAVKIALLIVPMYLVTTAVVVSAYCRHGCRVNDCIVEPLFLSHLIFFCFFVLTAELCCAGHVPHPAFEGGRHLRGTLGLERDRLDLQHLLHGEVTCRQIWQMATHIHHCNAYTPLHVTDCRTRTPFNERACRRYKSWWPSFTIWS